MSGFRAGRFQRELVPGLVRPFCPAHAVHKLSDVDPHGLHNRGIKLILVDVDNTLVKWRTEDFAQETLDWVHQAKTAGIDICIISNTRNPARLERLAKILEITALRGKFKPSTAMFKEAMAKFGVSESQTIMIGDQIFTDILGANRAGIEAIWLQPISPHDFVGTKVSRFGERVLRGYLYRAIHESMDPTPEPAEVAAAKPFWERKVVRQFVKFCIVGGSCFAIDLTIRLLLMFVVPYGDTKLSVAAGQWLELHIPVIFGGAKTPRDAFFPIAATMAASLAILNSFYWNRLWTFDIRGAENRNSQLGRFVVVSLIGLVWNVLLSSFFNHVLPGDTTKTAPLATALAAMFVAVWNFTGQRLYAFRRRK